MSGGEAKEARDMFRDGIQSAVLKAWKGYGEEVAGD